MTTQGFTEGSWVDAARHVVTEHDAVIVTATGWRSPDDSDWAVLEWSEADEAAGVPEPEMRDDGILLDIVTASMLVQIHDGLGDENRATFAAKSLPDAVTLGWKIVKRAREKATS